MQAMDRLLQRVADIVLQSPNLGYAAVDGQGLVTAHSANFTMQMALAGASLVGQSVWAWDMLVGAEADVQAVLAGTQTQVTVTQLQVSDGHYVDVHVLALEPGNPQAGWLLLVYNVTDLAHTQQALTQERNDLRLAQEQLSTANAELDRLNRFKTFMLSMVAHDLRSPLAAMRGYAEMALARLPSRHHAHLQRIIGLTERANLLIQNLIDLGQLERGQIAVRAAPVDVNALCAEAVATHQAQAALRWQTLTLSLPETPVLAWADAQRVQQMLGNLLSNALKYTPPGGQIEVALAQTEAQAIIEVADTGPGLTEAQRANLFQLHYRTEPARQNNVPGSGLGLFIVKTLAEAQHGTVQMESTPGVGSVFRVELPLVKNAP